MPLEKINQARKLVGDINRILNEHGIQANILPSDILITDTKVTDGFKENKKLSNAIIDHLWPSIKYADVYHFTQSDKAENIINNNIFRLNNIANRFNDGEIRTFCETHDLKGYLEIDESGEPAYKHLMANTFYASFTDTSLTEEREEYFWNNFSQCNGARLKFKISAINSDFRKIFYEADICKPIPLLFSLTTQIREKYNREFILSGISKLCAFYLSGKDYGVEAEYRVLYRNWGNSPGPEPIGNGKESYFELPLNQMTACGFKFEIIEVCANEKPNIPDAYTFLKRRMNP